MANCFNYTCPKCGEGDGIDTAQLNAWRLTNMNAMEQWEERKRLHRGPTRYELIAEREGQRVLIGYTMRQGRHVLLTAAQKHGPALIALVGLDDTARIEFLKPASLGARIGDWSIRYSGRTQREAIGSELPWIGNVLTNSKSVTESS